MQVNTATLNRLFIIVLSDLYALLESTTVKPLRDSDSKYRLDAAAVDAFAGA